MRIIGATERFWAKVDKTDAEGCWIWTGGKNENGYGRFTAGGHVKAHRFIYAETFGPIPEGLEIDHHCENPSCVRPDHLDVVTHDENMRRRSERQTHCKHGHRFDLENTIVRKDNGRRGCRACKRLHRSPAALAA